MKKVLMLLLIGVTLTGCAVNKFNADDISNIIDTVVKENNLVNTVAVGYKYYTPTGVTLVNSSSYNEKLYYNGDYYYLYVDIVEYYYKTDFKYEVNDDAYYSNVIEQNDKKGYLEINKVDDKYFIKAYYNYAKIEAYVDEKNLQNSIINIVYIISSVRFNNSVTELIVGRDELKLGEEKFAIFKSKRKEGTFLDYIEEYDRYDKEIIMQDEQNIHNDLGNES